MFLYGMSLMSGGLQKMAGDRMRSFMARMTSNYFTCILTGITEFLFQRFVVYGKNVDTAVKKPEESAPVQD